MNGTVVTSHPERGFFFVRPDGGTRDDTTSRTSTTGAKFPQWERKSSLIRSVVIVA